MFPVLLPDWWFGPDFAFLSRWTLWSLKFQHPVSVDCTVSGWLYHDEPSPAPLSLGIHNVIYSVTIQDVRRTVNLPCVLQYKVQMPWSEADIMISHYFSTVWKYIQLRSIIILQWSIFNYSISGLSLSLVRIGHILLLGIAAGWDAGHVLPESMTFPSLNTI